MVARAEDDATGWSAVAMRLDGRPGVGIHASIGLRFGFLAPAAAGALTSGTLLLGYAVIAHRRRARETGPPTPSPADPPPPSPSALPHGVPPP